MNTFTLLNRLGQGLDHNPGTASVRAARLDVLNQHYKETMQALPWLFLQTEANFLVYATVEGASGITVTMTSGSHNVLFTGVTPSTAWEGHIFLDPNGREYTINRVSGATAWTDIASNVSTAPTSESWSIEFRRYALPADCIEPLAWIDRAGDRGEIPFLSRAQEEGVGLDRDNTGDVEVFIEDDHVQDRAPDVGFTATAAAGGTLTASTIYEYCYTFTQAGRESPPSLVVTATTTAANLTVNLAGMEDTRLATQSTGIRKNVYRRNATLNGRWQLHTSDIAEATTTLVDSGTVTPSALESDVLFAEYPRQYVRPYYTASTDATLRLRYLKRVRGLVADSDVPVGPEAYHHLLLYRAMEELSVQHGQDPSKWEKLAEKTLGGLRKRYLVRRARTVVREAWGAETGASRRFDHVLSSDFTG